jgi:hypothetical protein
LNQNKSGGVHFTKGPDGNSKKEGPLTCANNNKDKKTIDFKLEGMFSPQAKLVSKKNKKSNKKGMSSTKGFLKKRLGEERFKEIVEQLMNEKVINYEIVQDFLRDEEKDLGMFLFTVVKNDTPKTGMSS